MKKNILDKPRGRTETLGDGKEYTFAPPSLRVLQYFEEQTSKKGGSMVVGAMMPITLLTSALLARLRPNYPDMTMEEVGDLIDTPELMALAKDITMELNSIVSGIAEDAE